LLTSARALMFPKMRFMFFVVRAFFSVIGMRKTITTFCKSSTKSCSVVKISNNDCWKSFSDSDIPSSNTKNHAKVPKQ